MRILVQNPHSWLRPWCVHFIERNVFFLFPTWSIPFPSFLDKTTRVRNKQEKEIDHILWAMCAFDKMTSNKFRWVPSNRTWTIRLIPKIRRLVLKPKFHFFISVRILFFWFFLYFFFFFQFEVRLKIFFISQLKNLYWKMKIYVWGQVTPNQTLPGPKPIFFLFLIPYFFLS